MAKLFILYIVAILACSGEGKENNLYQLFRFPYSHNHALHDPGEPLFLTPLINNNSLSKQQVRDMARVNGSQFLGVESYSGYLTIDELFNSTLFFWYFPAEQDARRAPVLLWLQGGPGASSLIGLFMENGPFIVVGQNKLLKRKYSWSRTHNVIYIDNPVGTGFSFTENDRGYLRNECQVGSQLYEAVVQLYKLFDWRNSSGFWITGESYAGKYVPALAYHIHMVQSTQQNKFHNHIPLKGIAIGNGLSDPLHQFKFGDYLYQLGLIDWNGLAKFQKVESAVEECIRRMDMECASDLADSLILGDRPEGSLFKNLTGFQSFYNYLRADSMDMDNIITTVSNFLQTDENRRALHVGNKTFHNMDKENKVKKFLKRDLMKSVVPWIEELLKYYTVCIYAGQLDIIVPYPMIVNYLKYLRFPGATLYKTAPRKIWRVDGEVAGYFKQAGNLIEVLVRNAGHLAPKDQPKWVYEMINHLTQSIH